MKPAAVELCLQVVNLIKMLRKWVEKLLFFDDYLLLWCQIILLVRMLVTYEVETGLIIVTLFVPKNGLQ